jgi:threonine-phosphate decarboxylase
MGSTWELARESVRRLRPCVHGGKVWGLEKEGFEGEILDFSSSVNPLGCSEKVFEAIKGGFGQVSDYPDSNCVLLREAIADCFDGVGVENVVVGNGSTELIYLFSEVFLDRGDVAVVPAPTFGEYESAVRRVGGNVRFVKLDRSFCLDSGVLKREMCGAKTVFLCNPNNPTSVLAPSEVLVEVVEAACDEDVLVFLDEDFLEFVDGDNNGFSLVREVNRFPNLFVLQSFTKVFGLAGLRAGYGFGSEEMIEILSNVKMPWNVNYLAQVAALAALNDKEHLARSRELVRVERAFLAGELERIRGFVPYPADANFILVNIRDSGLDAAQLKEVMLRRGILIRDCSSFVGLDSYHVRVAVKTRQENEILIGALREVVKENG